MEYFIILYHIIYKKWNSGHLYDPTIDLVTGSGLYVQKNLQIYIFLYILGGGKTVELFTNYFSVEAQPQWIIYQYYVEFSPEVDDKGLRKILLYHHKETIGTQKVYDGRMLYLPKKIKVSTFERHFYRSN